MNNPQQLRRHDIRLPEYDYLSPGTYFVTIVLKNRSHLFGAVGPEGVVLNPIGIMIQEIWRGLPEALPWIVLDEFVLMPDHLHGLLTLGSDPNVQERTSLGVATQRFKSISTLSYGKGVRGQNWPPYAGKLWAQNYFERIVRNDREHTKFQNYIRDNPYRWLQKTQM